MDIETPSFTLLNTVFLSQLAQIAEENPLVPDKTERVKKRNTVFEV